MNSFIFRLSAGFFLTIFLAAGSFAPTFRLAGGGILPAQANGDISELSRQFRSQTPSVVMFEPDRADLNPEARQRLDVQASWLRQHPTVRIRVYGLSAKAGNTAYNMALSLRRANAVVKYLARNGVESYRLEAAISFGEEIPVSGDASGSAAGRQATTRIIGFARPSTSADAGDGVTPVAFGVAKTGRGDA